MWAIVGLGNPGLKYRQTRHNAGFILVKRIAKRGGVRLRKKRFAARIARIRIAGQDILLALPQTYMNKSGESVKKIVEEGGISTERLIVVYDDMDLPVGKIRIRKEGSSGTHRGMFSIISSIQTKCFPRIRLGIGPLPFQSDAAEYVLSPFNRGERGLFEDSLERATKALEKILEGNIDAAMNDFNERVSPAEEGADGFARPSSPAGNVNRRDNIRVN